MSDVAAELGLGVSSVLWTLYDLHRHGLVFRSTKPVGVLSLRLGRRDVHLNESAYCLAASDGGEGIFVRGVRYVKWKHRKDGGSNSRADGTIQSRIMRLLSDGTPRSIRKIAGDLNLSEESTYNAVYLIYKRGAILRSANPRVEGGRNEFGVTEPVRHSWTLRRQGEKDCAVKAETFIGYKPREGKSLSQRIIEYVRQHLCERAAFTTDVRRDLEKRLGRRIIQSMVMYALSKQRHREVYVRGYQGAERMTPFEQGFAVTWIDPNLPREQALAEAKERTDNLLQDEQTSSPLFQRVHSIFDIVTDISLKRDIASQIYIMSELGCSRHQLELALEKTMEFYPAIKRVSIFGDERGNYGYPHYYHDGILRPDDLQAAVKAKERYLAEVKTSDERKGHALEGVVWWSLEKFRCARFVQQKHRTIGMHPYRHTLHLIKPVRRRKKSAEIDGVWESRESGTLCTHEKVTNVLETKFSLVRKEDLEDFVEIVKWSKQFGADERHGRIIRNGIVLWLAGGAIDTKATIPVGSDCLTVAQYAARLGIKFIPTSEINAQLQKHGWEKANVNDICRTAKDANEAMVILDEIWKQPKNAKEILAKYKEQNRSILEQERMLEARIKKARLSKTILDVEENEHGASEQGNQAAAG